MFKQNILISFRNIKRNKTSFFINLIGLSTGLACALLIYLWVYEELNIDKFHEKDRQLYQVMANYTLTDQVTTWDCTPAPLTETLLTESPEVEYAVPVCNRYHRLNGVLINGDNHIKAIGWFAGKDFFHVFSFKLIQGDKRQVLTDKNSVVISERLALKLFKTTKNIVGKNVEWNSYWKRTFQISGVFENPPTNASAQFDFLLNFDVLLDNDGNLKGWNSEPAYTYIILKKGTNIEYFNKKIADFIKLKPSRERFTLFIQQYSKRFLYGNYENGVQVSGRIIYVRLFSFIAMFILLIACINFMNLSTAQASRRIKEVGLKKIVGANRSILIIQFLTESMLMAFLSLIIAIILVVVFIPQYKLLTGTNLQLRFNTDIILSVLGITVFCGILAGSYPALYISKFSPAIVLKGKLNTTFGELWVRKGLVIFQFILSVIFIVSLIVISRQIEFVKNKNLGYNKENVISFRCNGKSESEFGTFMSELRNIPGVNYATNLYGGSIIENLSTGIPPGRKGQTVEQKIITQKLLVGQDFIETLNIKLLEGRSFSRNIGNEWSKIILNEAAAKTVGFKNPIGEFLNYGSDNIQIIGIVKNFHIKSLHEIIEPCYISFNPNGRDILLKIKAGEEMATINRIKKLVEEFQPGYPLEYTFLDEDYQALYKSENKVASLLKYFAGIAIIISCLGLFGMAAFTIERRQKEIGIRKVNGAKISEVMIMLNKDFIKWVAIAFVIATPIAWYTMHKWLQNFAYKTELSWWIFALAGLLALGIALLTVSWQSWRAATRNPVEALRNE